jgi:hypothetical protein
VNESSSARRSSGDNVFMANPRMVDDGVKASGPDVWRHRVNGFFPLLLEVECLYSFTVYHIARTCATITHHDVKGEFPLSPTNGSLSCFSWPRWIQACARSSSRPRWTAGRVTSTSPSIFLSVPSSLFTLHFLTSSKFPCRYPSLRSSRRLLVFQTLLLACCLLLPA